MNILYDKDLYSDLVSKRENSHHGSAKSVQPYVSSQLLCG